MKTWIVSSLDKETIQGEETIQGRKLYEEIRYAKQEIAYCPNIYAVTFGEHIKVIFPKTSGYHRHSSSRWAEGKLTNNSNLKKNQFKKSTEYLFQKGQLSYFWVSKQLCF